jgi:hypothetical protein
MVNKGDCLAKIAFASGFDLDTLWSYRNNFQLSRDRNSSHVLSHGDASKAFYVEDADGAQYESYPVIVLHYKEHVCVRPRTRSAYAFAPPKGL